MYVLNVRFVRRNGVARLYYAGLKCCSLAGYVYVQYTLGSIYESIDHHIQAEGNLCDQQAQPRCKVMIGMIGDYSKLEMLHLQG